MQYEVKKAPPDLVKARGHKRVDWPFLEMKVGDMFEIETSKKTSVYNAIKHRRNYTREIKGMVFSIRAIPGTTKSAVVRTR